MWLRAWVDRLRASRFLAKVSGLTAATLVSQALGAVTLVMLTRSLSEPDVGTYQVYLSYSAVVASVCLLSYPSVLPHLDESDYRRLTTALALVVGPVGATAGLAFGAFGYPFAIAIGAQVVAGGLASIGDMANIRRQRVGAIGYFRIGLAVSNMVWVAALRVRGALSLSIVLHGQVAIVLVLSLVYAALAAADAIARLPRPHEIRRILLAKKNCALFYAPSELLGSLTFNLPTLLIERYFGAALAGHYGVVLRFCGAPVNIMASSVGQVYHGNLAAAVRDRRPSGYADYTRVRRGLAVLGGVSGLFFFFVVPIAIPAALGSQWATAGVIARIMSPMYAVMLWVSPLAVASFQVFEAQKTLMLLQLASVTIAIAAFSGVGWFFDSFWIGVALYSALIVVRYLVFLSQVDRQTEERLCPHGLNGEAR